MIDPLPVGYVGLDEAVARLAIDISDQEVNKEQTRLKLDAAKELSGTALPWVKRELAIQKLHVALCDRTLIALVRDPASGELFQLGASDWRAAAFWREMIRGGCIRATIGEEIGRHDGRRVLLQAAAFEGWLKARMQRRPQAVDKDCGAWLESVMLANPNRKPKPKCQWRREAKEKFGVSGRAFDRIWDDEVKITGVNWNRAGALSKLSQ